MKYPTMFKPLYVLLAAVLLAMLAHAAQAGSTYYIDPTQTDLVHILAPPPARQTRMKAKQTLQRCLLPKRAGRTSK